MSLLQVQLLGINSWTEFRKAFCKVPIMLLIEIFSLWWGGMMKISQILWEEVMLIFGIEFIIM